MTIPRDPLSLHYQRLSLSWGFERYDPAAKLLRAPAFVREFPSHGRHMTRDSLYFARILLDTGDAAELARGCGIVDAVIATQVTREASAARGNFPWFAEDGEQGAWDPNWAAFN